MQIITDVPNLRGKTVLVRLGLNVPVEDGRVVDDFRIQKVRSTLDFLRTQGARIVAIAHIGREPDETLRPVFDVLQRWYPDAHFVDDLFT